MKSTIIRLLCAVFISLPAMAQKISAVKVPVAVTNAFKVKFSQAKDVDWEMEHDSMYEAEFNIGDTEKTATFNRQGQWQETETEIDVSGLPVAVRETINKQYAGYKIKEASRVEHIQYGNCYEVEVTKGKEHMDVMISPEGNILLKTSEK